jgi:tetratricopeptide (TPR) repeat protein
VELDAGEDEDATPLPLLEWTDEDGAGAPALPLIGADLEPEAAGAGDVRFELHSGLERALEESAPPRRGRARTPEELIAASDLDGAERLIRELMESEPEELAHRQRLVEVAYRRGDVRAQSDAYVELARCLERAGSRSQAEGVYQQALQLDPENAAARAALADSSTPAAAEVAPVASSEDYVDLGSLIFGEMEQEKTTRFLVEYEEPTGDEQADFARMLSQFKTKIAQNVAADDVRAHHDLGTAYKEMGLLDEAIEEFQAALRASRDHLPTYELLGQCFIDKGEPEAAVMALRRALNLGIDVEDDLLGIYYFLGRAYERIGDKEAAVEYYDRVFSLDINFMDVTERLRALR